MKNFKWGIDNIIDQTDRVAIVTGASSGLGLETARVLAIKNATVIMAVRNLNKGQVAMSKIKTDAPSADVRVMELDLANLASVRRFSDQFKNTSSRVDLLINNAGVMVPPYSQTTDGFELQMGTNHLGHFALTGLLIDLLKATPGSRVVNVSSMVHKMGRPDFDDLAWQNRKYKKWQAYGDSKMANLLFTHALQTKLGKGGANVTVAAAHPGWTATELQRNASLISALNNFFAQKPAMGALPTLYAATAPDVENADFYGPNGLMEMKGYPKKVRSVALAQDQEMAERLWQASEALTGVKYPE